MSSKFGKRQLVMKNNPEYWSQLETVKYFERIIMKLLETSVKLREHVQISVGNPIMGNGPDQFSDGSESVPICRH